MPKVFKFLINNNVRIWKLKNLIEKYVPHDKTQRFEYTNNVTCLYVRARNKVSLF